MPKPVASPGLQTIFWPPATGPGASTGFSTCPSRMPATAKILVISYWTGLATDPATTERSVRHIGCYRDTMIKIDGTWLIAKKIIDPWNADTITELGPMI